MSELAQPPHQEESQKPTHHNKKVTRKKSLILFFISLIVVTLVAILYYLLYIYGTETTDDAYVHGNQVAISSQVSGTVMQINVHNTLFVRQGDVLARLNPKDREIALNQAESQLADVVRKIHNLSFTVKKLQAGVAQKKILLAQAKADYLRQLHLNKTHATTALDLSHSKDAYESAKASLAMMENDLQANQALLLNTPLSAQPAVKNAISAVRNAWLNLQRTNILSPVDGYVVKRNVQVGESIEAGRPLMAVIPTDQMWIEANFKETQLKQMRIGQKARVILDFYGNNVKFDGTIEGIEMGTGSVFSLLPAQNATGNWIKIVQRLPVRIALDSTQITQHPLRLGLSATVSVDVSHPQGEVLAPAKPLQPLYQTKVLSYDEQHLNQRIEQIMQENSGK